MAFTSHGHQIPGTIAGTGLISPARCGGVNICPRCKSEVESSMSINFVGEVPVVNRLDGSEEEGQVVGTAKLEKIPDGSIIAHIDMSEMTGQTLSQGFSIGSFSISENPDPQNKKEQ